MKGENSGYSSEKLGLEVNWLDGVEGKFNVF